MGRPSRYSPEVRERAVRMVFDHRAEYETEWATITSIAHKIGCSTETLRNWVRQAERDAAAVDEDHTGLLIEKFTAGGDSLPPSILESLLLHDAGTSAWRIVTMWTSREALDRYRTAVETPEGVRMFRAAGAEPALSVWEVAAHADHV